jgi:outer membrane protein
MFMTDHKLITSMLVPQPTAMKESCCTLTYKQQARLFTNASQAAPFFCPLFDKNFKHKKQTKMSVFIKVLFMAALCMLSLTTVHAQKAFTLQAVIDTALKNSLQLQSDRYQLAKTKAAVGQAYSSLLPSIDASGSYQYQFKVPTQIIPAEMFGGPAGTYQAAAFSVPQSKSVTAQFSQTLFNASSLIALKAAKVAINLNELQIQSSREDLVYNVSATYYNLQTNIRQQELLRNNLSNTRELLKVTAEQLAAGLATQTDVDRLTVSRDNAEASLQNAVNSEQKLYNLLKVLINVPLERAIRVTPEDYHPEEISLNLPETDITRKTNYLQIQENKRVASLQRRNIMAGYLPALSLTGSLGYSSYYSNANPFKSINDKWYPSSSIGVKLSIPIFDGFSKKYQVQQKDFELKNYDVQAEQTLQQNRKEVADAYADLTSNYTTLQTQKRNLNLAQKVLDDINIQYRSGIVRLTDVINAQTELQSAQNNYINALISLRQASLSLKKAQGTLLN